MVDIDLASEGVAIGDEVCLGVDYDEYTCVQYEGALQISGLFPGTHVVEVETSLGHGSMVVDVIGRKGEGVERDVEGVAGLEVGGGERDETILVDFSGTRLRVGLLCITFEKHSQNGIFLKLGKNLPRDKFEVNVFGFEGDTDYEGGVGEEFVVSFVPVWAVSWGAGGYEGVLEALRRCEDWISLPRVVRTKLSGMWSMLKQMDVVLIANSHDDGRMFVLLEVSGNSSEAMS